MSIMKIQQKIADGCVKSGFEAIAKDMSYANSRKGVARLGRVLRMNVGWDCQKI